MNSIQRFSRFIQEGLDNFQDKEGLDNFQDKEGLANFRDLVANSCGLYTAYIRF